VADVKRIRFLTGAHAGAQIPLPTGAYRIGADEACEICITDWQDDELTLTVDDNDTVHMRQGKRDNIDSAHVLAPDFVALQFGATTFCVGPHDAVWPTDIDLLSGMFTRQNDAHAPAPRTARSSLKVTGAALASMMVACAVVAGAIIAGTQPSEAVSATPNAEALAARLSASLHAIGLRELNAKCAGNAVIVQGMVPTAQDDVVARKLIERIGGKHVQRGYDVVQDDMRSIQESLAIEGTRVTYSGNGVFLVGGTVPSLDAFHQALENVRGDFDANVKRIQSNVSEGATPVTSVSYSAMVSSGDVRYFETPDGVKHVYQAAPRSVN